MDTAESEESALYVHGVGWIAQYHHWADMLWEKGIPFFIRDIKFLTKKKYSKFNFYY